MMPMTKLPGMVDSFTYGYNALMANINEENLTGVRLLIESGQVGVDDRDDSGVTALMTACQRNKLDAVKLLLDKGADVNAEDSDNWTPLHFATKEGHSAIVSYLMSHGANIEARDDGGWTPLMWACYKGRKEIARLLLEQGANVNAAGHYSVTSLAWAAGRNHLDIVKDLIRSGADVNSKDKYGTTPLIWAARKGNLQIVQALVEAKADIDAAGMNSWTALIVASAGNHRDVVKFLLGHKPNLDAQDKDGCTALTKACKAGLYDVASDLIAAGAAVNLVDRNGNSNLIHATKAGQRNILKLLLDNSADVNIQGRDNKTALYWAIEKFQMGAIPILLSANPNLEAQTKDGDTALMKATRNRSPEIITYLLERRAKVSTKDQNGDNALHIAMRARSKDIVELLLRNPVNSQLLYRANAVGETPYGIDRTSAKPVITQLFGTYPLKDNTQDDFENSTGYSAYCSALADMLSDPTLHMPLTVGLFANWGAGRSFLLERLQQELASFSRVWQNPLFSWSPLLLSLAFSISVLVGAVVGLVFYDYINGIAISVICFLFLLTALFIIWFYTQHSLHLDSCWHKMSRCIGGRVEKLKLILQVILCHPAGRQSNDTNQTHPIKFYFTEHTKINTSLDKENSLVQMLSSLFIAIESDYGTFPTRLFRAFTPQPLDAHANWKWRKFCGIPCYLLFLLCILSAIASVVVIYLELMGTWNNWDYDSIETSMSLSSIFLGFFFLANLYSSFMMLKAIVVSHKTHLVRRIEGIQITSRQGFLHTLKAEVNLMIQMLACLDSFTQRQSRMVILVDGLDTAEQEKVMVILDAVHILFGDNKAPFIIVLAIDPNAISDGLDIEQPTGRDRRGSLDAKDYMKNIANLPFYMKNHNLKASKRRDSERRQSGAAEETSPTKRKNSTKAGGGLSDEFDCPARLENELPPFKNEASDLNILLEDEDYFSDLSPRAMQKMMNIIRITGRLLKAFDVDFTWEQLSCWVNVTERWPYKLSWICIYCLVCQNQILEEYTLLSIYNKIKHLIPGHHLDKNSNLDACDNKLSWYLEEHRGSLTVANLFTFLPYTISLDPYLRKEIMKKFRPDENFFTNCTFSGTGIESTESIVSEAGITPGSRSPGSTDPNMSEDTIGRITSFKQLGQVELEELSAESVVELFLGLKGFSFNEEVFRNIIRENGISGNVLKCCDLQDLKRVLNMNFGDWEMFKMAVGILRQN